MKKKKILIFPVQIISHFQKIRLLERLNQEEIIILRSLFMIHLFAQVP